MVGLGRKRDRKQRTSQRIGVAGLEDLVTVADACAVPIIGSSGDDDRSILVASARLSASTSSSKVPGRLSLASRYSIQELHTGWERLRKRRYLKSKSAYGDGKASLVP